MGDVEVVHASRKSNDDGRVREPTQDKNASAPGRSRRDTKVQVLRRAREFGRQELTRIGRPKISMRPAETRTVGGLVASVGAPSDPAGTATKELSSGVAAAGDPQAARAASAQITVLLFLRAQLAQQLHRGLRAIRQRVVFIERRFTRRPVSGARASLRRRCASQRQSAGDRGWYRRPARWLGSHNAMKRAPIGWVRILVSSISQMIPLLGARAAGSASRRASLR